VLATPAALALHNNFRTSVLVLQRSLVRSIHYLTVIQERRVHRALGYTSITDYAADVAGFTRNQTEAFLALGRRLAAYPEVRQALDRGDLSWSKARLIVERAKPEDEHRWVTAAGSLAVRELTEALPRRATEIGEAGVGPAPDPGSVRVTPLSLTGKTMDDSDPAEAPQAPAPADEKCHVTYALTPEEYALWSAAHDSLRRQGRSASRAQLLLAALASLAAGAATDGVALRYLLQIHHCPACDAAEIRNHRGRFAAPPALLATARCDAVVENEQSRRRTVIPPRLRRLVLRRDGYACRAPGCGNAAFVEIHHRVPVAAGGRSEIENLITLCGRCHRALHEREIGLQEAARGPAG
jgi:5-methylcytosine-specific restriction endonuclease McrA